MSTAKGKDDVLKQKTNIMKMPQSVIAGKKQSEELQIETKHLTPLMGSSADQKTQDNSSSILLLNSQQTQEDSSALKTPLAIPSPKPADCHHPKKIIVDGIDEFEPKSDDVDHSHNFSGCACEETAPQKGSFSISDEERQGPRHRMKPQSFELEVENIEEDQADKSGILKPNLGSGLNLQMPRSLALKQQRSKSTRDVTKVDDQQPKKSKEGGISGGLKLSQPASFQTPVKSRAGSSRGLLSLNIGSTPVGAQTSEKKEQMRARVKMNMQFFSGFKSPEQEGAEQSTPASAITEHSRLSFLQRQGDNLNEEYQRAKEDGFESKYVFGKNIGEGCSASVYVCYQIEDKERKKPFAVKVVREDDEERLIALKKEAAIMKGLKHENIVQTIETFENPAKGELQMVMQYIDGMEVLDHLAKQPHGHYTEEMAKDFFRQIMEGISYLHDIGVCHRDIKPQNLVVDKQGKKVYILDFNVCAQRKPGQKKFEMRTKTGTASFSAPEIFTSDMATIYDEKVDVWSAGIVLNMMLSGVQPFQSDDVSKLVHSILNEHPNFSELLHDCSSEALDLVTRMLDKDPDERPSAQQCLEHPWLSSKFSLPSDDLTLRKQKTVLMRASDNLSQRSKLKQSGKLSKISQLKVKDLYRDMLVYGLDLNQEAPLRRHTSFTKSTRPVMNHCKPQKFIINALECIDEEAKTPSNLDFYKKQDSIQREHSSNKQKELNKLTALSQVLQSRMIKDGKTPLQDIQKDLLEEDEYDSVSYSFGSSPEGKLSDPRTIEGFDAKLADLLMKNQQKEAALQATVSNNENIDDIHSQTYFNKSKSQILQSVKKREYGSHVKNSSEENENTESDNRRSEQMFRMGSDGLNFLTPVDEEEEKSALIDTEAIKAQADRKTQPRPQLELRNKLSGSGTKPQHNRQQSNPFELASITAPK